MCWWVIPALALFVFVLVSWRSCPRIRRFCLMLCLWLKTLPLIIRALAPPLFRSLLLIVVLVTALDVRYYRYISDATNMTRDSTASPWDSLSCYSSRRNILKNLNIVKGRQKPLHACWKIGKTFKKFISLNLGSSISNCANYYHGDATDITICLCQKFETSFRGKVIWTQSSKVSFNHSSKGLRFRVHFSVNGFYKGCNYILLFFRYLTTKRVAV